MVDFKKRLKKQKITRKLDPIEIYDSLDRRSETGPLRPSQLEILNEWFSKRQGNRNNIIKLHTGEGKTLVGLLILQSRINAKKGPCVFVCPNKYLAEQVKQDADKFGIPYCDFSKSSALPDDFILGETILITHVQKLFNGKTVFGLGNKSTSVDTIIMDDSHACIDSIKSALTVNVDSDHPVYALILALFGDDIREQGEGSYMEIVNGNSNTMLPIPYWSWIDKFDEVTKAILDHSESEEIAFVWPIIKDNIDKCQGFISGNRLEISPTLMPIDSFGSFSRANQRILMSATTQDDSFFIKGLGFDIDSVKFPLSNKHLKWSGEKMILIPSLIDESLNRSLMINWLLKPSETRNVGVVSLIPSFHRKAQYESIGADVATTHDIFDHVQRLKSGDCEQAVAFANRYDGIDLPDNACRVLVLDSKPYFDSLIDRYEEDCRPNSDIVNIRVAQKIEQGLGRSVRGEKDYSVIVLVGGDLIRFVKSPMTARYFSSQTRKQIEIGMHVAEFAVEDAQEQTQTATSLVTGLIDQILSRDEGWKEYYTEEMDQLDYVETEYAVHSRLEDEFKAEQLFSIGEYDKACATAQKLCDESADDSEKGWYLQHLARYKYRVSKVEADKIQKSAFQKNLQLLKPREGISYRKMQYMNQNRIRRIISWIASFDSYEDLMIAVDGMLQDLSFGMPSERFETALCDLGEAIGFMSQRPDKEIKKGPDNLWCGVDNYYFMFECKNEVNELRKEINKHEAGQMNSHCAWFKSEYGDASCRKILIIPTKSLSYHGDFSDPVQIMRANNLRQLKNSVRSFFKEFSKYNLDGLDENAIHNYLNTHELDVEDLKSKFSEPYIKSEKM